MVASATLDAQLFKDFFETHTGGSGDNSTTTGSNITDPAAARQAGGGATQPEGTGEDDAVIISVSGRQYPVDVLYR